MANVLNKLLEICEILDTKGGSGGSGSTGGSGGGSTSGNNRIDMTLSAADPSELANTNTSYILTLGRYDATKAKDLKLMITIFDIEADGMVPLYELQIINNSSWDSLKVFNLNMKSDDNDSKYGSMTFSLNTITIDGTKLLALKIANSTIATNKSYEIMFYVFGTDDNQQDTNSTYMNYPIAKTDESKYQLQTPTKGDIKCITTVYQNDGVFSYV